MYRNKNVQLRIGFELVVKTLQCIIKTQKECWRSTRTKNEMLTDLISCVYQNAVKFAFVLCDSWYVNAENIKLHSLHQEKFDWSCKI